MNRDFLAFWGCTISQRLPYVESNIRKVFAVLGVVPRDIEGVSCCPDPLYAKTLPHLTWLGIAARNLALAERSGTELVSMCNGCYKVLKTAQIELKNPGVRESVNKNLRQFGLEYKGGIEPIHFIQYLKKIGRSEIKKQVKYKLTGLMAGVHYGCHILRPNSIAVDSAKNPRTIEEFLEDCGIEIREYEEKELCCGGTLAPFDQSSSQELLRKKMRSLKKAGADCLVTVCPSCFVQYDIQSRNLKEQDRLPIFYLTDLLALAFGIPAEELNFKRHIVDVTPVLDKAGIAAPDQNLLKYFDLKRLGACCEACSFECSVAKGQGDADLLRFNPIETVKKVVAGDIEGALKSPEIWRCLGCYDCSFHYPHNEGLGAFFETLRQLAIERGIVPETAQVRREMFEKEGTAVKGSEAARKRMGLPPAAKADMAEIKKILKDTSK
ncbi:MAG: heterodisulfide reductase-related iron-sulfur binding cluster [bacterium]